MASIVDVPSWDDPRLAGYRGVADPAALARQGECLIEGRLVVPRLLDLARKSARWRGRIQSVLVTPAALDQLAPALASHDRLTVYRLAADHWTSLTGFNLHRGCLALAHRPDVPTLETLSLGGLQCIVVLEGVSNPDNIGGIFRSAAALGADLVVLGPSCGDPLYRKAIRTSMGAALEVPYATTAAWPGALSHLQMQGFFVAALTTPPADVMLPDWTRPRQPIALLAGAEGHGLTPEAQALASRRVSIPMTGRVDSLNVATAVSIALYHAGWTPHRDTPD